MDFTELKQRILGEIKTLKDSNLEILYPESETVAPWNQMNSDEIKVFVNSILDTLGKLPDEINLLDELGYSQVQNIYNQLVKLNNALSILSGIQDTQIRSEHHDALNRLNNIDNILRSTGIRFELNAYPDTNEVKKLIADTKRAKRNAEGDSKIVENLRVQAESNLAGKVNADLQRYLSDSHVRYKNISLGILAVFLMILVIGFIYIIHPVWDILVSFLIGNQDRGLLLEVVFKVPQAILYISLLYILASFYRRYETLSIAMEHKGSVIGGLPHYTNQLFEKVNNLDDKASKNEVRKEIVRFEIDSLGKVFEQPAVSEKMMRMQVGVNNKGASLSVGGDSRE